MKKKTFLKESKFKKVEYSFSKIHTLSVRVSEKEDKL